MLTQVPGIDVFAVWFWKKFVPINF